MSVLQKTSISSDPSNLRTGQLYFKRDPQRSREMLLDSIAIFKKKKMLPPVNTGKRKKRKKETTDDLD